MSRHAWPVDQQPGAWRLGCCRRQRGFDPRDVGAQVFKAELQLIVIKPFGTTAKLTALQLPDDEPQPFDLGLRGGEAGAFGRQRPHHSLQRLYIVRQGRKIDVHGRESN